MRGHVSLASCLIILMAQNQAEESKEPRQRTLLSRDGQKSSRETGRPRRAQGSPPCSGALLSPGAAPGPQTLQTLLTPQPCPSPVGGRLLCGSLRAAVAHGTIGDAGGLTSLLCTL